MTSLDWRWYGLHYSFNFIKNLLFSEMSCRIKDFILFFEWILNKSMIFFIQRLQTRFTYQRCQCLYFWYCSLKVSCSSTMKIIMEECIPFICHLTNCRPYTPQCVKMFLYITWTLGEERLTRNHEINWTLTLKEPIGTSSKQKSCKRQRDAKF